MLPRSNRVNRASFKVLTGGKAYHGPFFSLRITRLPEGRSSFSVVVSGTVSKKAAQRNLLRRRIYSHLREVLEKLPKGTRGAFFAKKGAPTLSPSLQREAIDALLRQAKLID